MESWILFSFRFWAPFIYFFHLPFPEIYFNNIQLLNAPDSMRGEIILQDMTVKQIKIVEPVSACLMPV